MVKLNHNSPFLKLLDNMRRENSLLNQSDIWKAGDRHVNLKKHANRNHQSDKLELHKYAISLLAHYEKHQNYTPINSLVAMVKSKRVKSALIEWFSKFGKLELKVDSQEFVYNRNGINQIEEASKTPYWKFQPKPKQRSFKLGNEITKLAKKARERQRSNCVDDDIPEDLLISLEEVLGSAN